MVLFVALIALVSMLLSGIALMRSSDTANVIAGNFAWKESSLQAADVGVDLAFAMLAGISNASTNNVPIANQYFPVMQGVDTKGIPTGINWSGLTATQVTGTGNSIKYVIERMCQGSPSDSVNGPAPANTAEISRYCITVVSQNSPGGSGGSNAAGHAAFMNNGAVYYRVTVRVSGPRDAVSMVQGMISL